MHRMRQRIHRTLYGGDSTRNCFRLLLALACLLGVAAPCVAAGSTPISVADWTSGAKPETAEGEPAAPAEPVSIVEAEPESMRARILAAEQDESLKAKLHFDAVTVDELYHALESLPDRQDLPLTLQDCIAVALISNQDILVTSFEALKSDGELMQSKGEFDPQFNFKATYGHSENSISAQTSAFTGLGGSTGGGGGSLISTLSSIASNFANGGLSFNTVTNNLMTLLTSGAFQDLPLFDLIGDLPISGLVPGADMLSGGYVIESEKQDFEVSLQGKLHWGTTYELKLGLTEEESTYSQMQEEWSGGATISLKQPLLRGFGPSANLARIRRSANARVSAEHQLEQQVMVSISDVVKAYWDLVGAHEQLRVREQSLENAERLLNINLRRLDLGEGAALEVLQSKAGLATRISDLVSARSQVVDAEDKLKQLLDLRDEEALIPFSIVPLDRPARAAELEMDEATCIERALENRPEIRISELEIDSANIERKRAANDMLPQFDLNGAYFRGGRGDKARVVFEGIEYENDMSYSVGVEGSIPITNRAYRGAYHYASMTMRQAEQRLVKNREDIIVNVRMALRALETAQTLIESNQQSVALQEINVEAERKRRTLGLTTTYDVLKMQEDLTTAQTQEVQSVVNYQKAAVDLLLAQGVILGEYGVAFEPPEPEKPVGFFRSLVPPTPKHN